MWVVISVEDLKLVSAVVVGLEMASPASLTGREKTLRRCCLSVSLKLVRSKRIGMNSFEIACSMGAKLPPMFSMVR